MDPIEVGRQEAARLHEAAVAAGHDPWIPYEFVVAEASRRGLEVECVPCGDVRLHGTHALYDPDALLILHEDTGSVFTNAFLVAHEIGHVALGGTNEPSAVINPDPLRSAEAAPFGIERVVDYGRRERREVQMNLFGREFLLPRPVARRLHLNGATATDIAQRLGAPFGVVAQQLLDALLLPLVELRAAAAGAPRPLNPEQAKAITHRGTPYLLEAGPGTGKTHALVGRVEHLLASGVDPSCILVLTYSNKAAGELSERIAARCPQAAAVWTGTFHAFGLDLIRRFYDRLHLPPDPRMLDRTEAIELLEHEVPKLGLVHFRNLWDPTLRLNDILAAISRAKDEVVDAAGHRRLAEAMLRKASTDEDRIAAERSLEVSAVFAAYEELKRDRGLLDFGDLVAMPVRLCEEHADVQAHLASRYEHVLVDEFQDVNRGSVRLLKALTRDGRNLWVVGDPKQSIYRFRGASSFNVARFGREDFPGAERGHLTINYRSVAEITQACVHFAREGMRVVQGMNVQLAAERGSSGLRPEHLAVGTADEEIAAVAAMVGRMREAGFQFRDQAVLCAGHEKLGACAGAFEALGIPVLYLGSLFEREEVRELLSLLSLLTDRRAMGLLRAAGMPGFLVPLSDVAAVLTYLAEHESEPMAWSTLR